MDQTASLPVGADMGVWAANEVQKHEEVCGLRYEAIAREQKRLADLLEQSQRDAAAALLKSAADQGVRIKAIEDKISGAVKWVMGIVASMSVALVLMFFQNNQAQKSADESDKREMRARLSLLTTQLQNVSLRGTVVVSPAGMQTTSVPQPDPPAVD